MEHIVKYIKKKYYIDMDALNEVGEEFPEIKKIVIENNNNFNKLCKIIEKNNNFTEEMKKNIIDILLCFSNLSSETTAFKYLVFLQIQIINYLKTELELKDEKIKSLTKDQ